MSTTDNKNLIQHIFAEMSKGNPVPFRNSLADDVRWRIMGTTQWSKTFQGKQAVLTELLGPLFELFANPLTVTADRFIAEGDLVVVEGRGNATTKAGKPYNNSYCWIYRVADGKIKEITEYLDTELVTSALSASASAAQS